METWNYIPESFDEALATMPTIEDMQTAARVVWWLSGFAHHCPDAFAPDDEHNFVSVANNIPAHPDSYDWYISLAGNMRDR